MAKTLIGFSVSALLLLSACGGGGSSDKKNRNIVSSDWRAGVYADSNDFKNKCEVPRTGRSKITGELFPDQKGSSLDEKNFLRSWSHETYLWYKELPDIDPGNGDTPQKYFEKLKTDGKTLSGKQKDYFHFSEPTESAEAWEAGISYGYGMELIELSPRVFAVLYVQPNSPADNQGVKRGDRIIELNGYVVASENSENGLASMNDALAPDNIGELHEFKFQREDSSYEVELTSAQVDVSAITKTEVIDRGSNKVGYIQFNTFIDKAENEWIDAVNYLKSAGVSDLVLDLRYNGGGSVAVASQVGYMIGGSNVAGKTFVQYSANDQYQSEPPDKFSTTDANDVALPSLNFNRVYILTTNNTCSASELVINGLRGVGVDVYLVGDNTCGKPYAFFPQPNCGTTYYTIQLKGVNAQGYGDYVEGFEPANSENSSMPHLVKGCTVADDINFQLGETDEPLLAKALTMMQTGGCDTFANNRLQKMQAPVIGGKIIRSPRDEIAIYDL